MEGQLMKPNLVGKSYYVTFTPAIPVDLFFAR